ncbi:MAG: YchJ family metal-binding protein [Planctomycetota bacterium]
MPGPDTLVSAPCPCGRPAALGKCCGRYLSGGQSAPDAESLMRSRYTAFALGTAEAIDYLVETHHPAHREPDLRAGIEATVASVDSWEGLRVMSAQADGDRGTVEFVAAFRLGDHPQQLHERSEFVREGSRWLYTRGEIH